MKFLIVYIIVSFSIKQGFCDSFITHFLPCERIKFSHNLMEAKVCSRKIKLGDWKGTLRYGLRFIHKRKMKSDHSKFMQDCKEVYNN